MSQAEKVPAKQIAQYSAALNHWQMTGQKIIERVNYIVETSLKVFGVTNFVAYDVYDMPGAVEFFKEEFRVDINFFGGHGNMDEAFILIREEALNIFDGVFPKRWLWQNFEKELLEGKKAFDDSSEKELIQNDPDSVLDKAKKKLYAYELKMLQDEMLEEFRKQAAPMQLVRSAAAKAKKKTK